jgi:hypothetical protein
MTEIVCNWYQRQIYMMGGYTPYWTCYTSYSSCQVWIAPGWCTTYPSCRW